MGITKHLMRLVSIIKKAKRGDADKTDLKKAADTVGEMAEEAIDEAVEGEEDDWSDADWEAENDEW